jgi:hypothetical protein
MSDDGRHDFDFLLGRWRVHNRRLARPLAGPPDWREFETVAEVRPVLGGLGNVDSFAMARPTPADGWEGMTLRLFDPASRRWSIWWASTAAPGRLDPPLTGAFRDGLGEFFGDDVLEDRPIRLRFHWSAPAPGSARWEQAFSADAGATWETNWIMSLRREG